MSGEQRPASSVENANTEAEKDAQTVLDELKADESEAKQASADKKPNDIAAAENAEEKRVIEAAAKLAKDAEKAEAKNGSKSEDSGKAPSRRGGRTDHRNNIKFDATTAKATDDPVEIRKQVEFYFSDSNLPMDKFLLSKVGGSANKSIPLTLIHSFKRMRRFQPFSAIVEALRFSETLELTDNDICVRRNVPLPESVTEASDPNVVKVFEDKAMSRSIYAKGFGIEEPSTQFDIEAFFAPYGPTNAVRLRRAQDKTFKGSVFVEFDSEEAQQKFLVLEPKPKWKGQDLIIKSKKEYCEEKVKDIEAGRVKPNRGRGGFGGRGRGGDRRNWKERKSDDQKKGADKENRGNKRQEVHKDARGVPVVQSTVTEPSQKRAREDEAATNADRPVKKVDVKQA